MELYFHCPYMFVACTETPLPLPLAYERHGVTGDYIRVKTGYG
jgi:hypothetical protein